ncbi:Calcineurin-like phosphoesterase superfamily domain protein [Bhargavaea cecembensis DSE10]|uniref:Calcineurin-like phosphoesterase superfamily domain protein n=1 Tax=Bhargavaea cecembensis DSE10 TaxID=1235279 RepID=M7P0D2_9BACL|nr:metallophosphoesterase [Bhargavaea cecembensis]EMR07360.1 Calcineurin-like phosphoesterase superfamily domain protein [Bhargavaea cecembensis DSE10]
MRYALLGDIHSSVEDLRDVLNDIQKHAPDAELIGTGDLFECIISKKRAPFERFGKLDDVMLYSDELMDMLTFPSVRGNQEDRIAQITESDEPLLQRIRTMEERFRIEEKAEVIHGHQWEWGGDPWMPVFPETGPDLIFFGHSHDSGLSIDNQVEEVGFGIPYDVTKGRTFVNVGAVVGDRSWVLYDSDAGIVIFMKVID